MRNKWRSISTLFLIIILSVFSLVSCTEDPDIPGVEITVEDEKPSAGGKVFLGCVEPQSLNPILNKNKSYMDISKLLFQGMFEYDSSMKLVPALAESWSFNNGTSQCMIKLRSDINWSDGQPFDARDVKFTMDTIKYSTDSIYKKNLQHIYYYQIVDDYTIKVNFDKASVNVVDDLIFPIIPEHIYKNDAKAMPVVTGMYKVSEYVKTKSMSLVQNETWKGEKTPYIPNIEVLFINDLDAFSTAFRAGELDIINTTAYDWEKYKELQDVTTYKYATNNFDFMALNFNNPLFQDKTVRKALVYGINRKSVIDKYLLGNAQLIDAPVNPGSWLYDGKGIIYGYNKNEAQRLLASAGFLDSDNDKVIERKINDKTQTFSFTIITNNDSEFRKNACEEIKKNLADIGISVDLQFLPLEEIKQRLDTKKFDAAFVGYNLSPNQDTSFLFSSNQIFGGKNFSSYTNPELDDIFAQIQYASDAPTIKSLYERMQALMREEVPCISFMYRDAALVVKDKVKGDIKPDIGNLFRNFEQWYVKKDKQ